jgi:hypothetical protein
MKRLIVFLLFLTCLPAVQAQEVFRKGTNVVNIGDGLGEYFVPLEVSYERGIVDGLIQDTKGAIGVGGYGALYSNMSTPYLVLGVRAAFHYQFVRKLDTYAGLMTGYDLSGSSLVAGTFAGGRYYFHPNLAVYSELGYGVAFLSAGVAFNF